MKDKSGENSKSTDAHSDSSNRGDITIKRSAYKLQKLRICRTEVPSVDKNGQQDGGVAGNDEKISRKSIYGRDLDGKLHLVGISINNGLYSNFDHLYCLSQLERFKSNSRENLGSQDSLELSQYFEDKYKNKDQGVIEDTQITLREYRNARNKVSVDAELAEQHSRKWITHGDEEKMIQKFDHNYQELLAIEKRLKEVKTTIEASERKKYLETIQKQFPELKKESDNHINKIKEFLEDHEKKEIVEEDKCKSLHTICGNAASQIEKVRQLLDKNGQDRSNLSLELGCLAFSIQTLREAAGKLSDFQEKVDKSVIVDENRVSSYHGGESSSSQGRS